MAKFILPVLALLASTGLATPLNARDDEGPVGITCGLRLPDCPEPLVCVPDDAECTIYGACIGTCQVPYPDCGGHRPDPPTCKPTEVCVADSRILDYQFIADLPGICLPPKGGQACGDRFPGCPEGTSCVDDTRVPCDSSTTPFCPKVCLFNLPNEP